MAQAAAPVDKAAALRGCHLLIDFTDVGLKILAELADQRSIGRGLFAFRAGDPSGAISFVAKGTLQLVPGDGGAALGEVVAGDTVGGMSLLVEGEHVLSAVAATDVELLQISRDVFEGMKKTHPRTALKLTLALAQDLAERLREAKGPLREFLVWQISKRQAEGR
ncbi:MAG TPA: Crp/Fnr family transcriptional regulator [Myxococcales bacterium]|nr:Crp/Fnr family transcriptional regulator [Myxococcales bacterium]